MQPFALLPAHTLEPVAEEGGADAVWDAINHNPPPLDGPYILESFDRGTEAMLVRNPHFAGHRPALRRIVIRNNKRQLIDVAKDGDLDLCPLVSAHSMDLVSRLDTFDARRDPSAFQFYLQPDVTQPPFDDLRVRQAVSHAIDRDAVALSMFGEKGLPAHTYVPPHDPAHAPDVRQYNGGPQAARALLREAGHTQPVPVRLRSMRRKAGGNEEATLLLVKAQLEAAGFDVTLDLVDGSVFRDYLSGTHGALLFYSQRHAKIGAFWNVPYEDNLWQLDTPARAYDDHAVALYHAFSHTLSPERRKALARQLQEHYAERVPTIPLTFGPQGSVLVTGLSGWDPGAGGETAYWNVETWSLDIPQVFHLRQSGHTVPRRHRASRRRQRTPPAPEPA